jgi:hypothetical protein
MMTTDAIRDLVERLGLEMFGPAFPDASVDAEGDMVVMDEWTIRRDDGCTPPAWVVDRVQPSPGDAVTPPSTDVVEMSRHEAPACAVAGLMAYHAHGLALGILAAWDAAEAPEEEAF